ncbi:isopentenyl-diphosphate Delta-isomerase [Spectribacter hydrogenoxidans]|uniref:Isopentenyl-diphosphate Delta-isomerase n=1 Tax=Spectribacter hydrogenoxidans TaxID=3075608 RepID=A0ABU3C2K1_9GAMM|nr:isopentenyl-diphosphate Delta-isomerase [Salinisphaera sp. W335]MDT0635783.1 isopentenyl-diphosphate Delta-isomerase [Salinisphaera sp. W335]
MPSTTPANHAVVSFDDEPLIRVDSEDNLLGFESKDACHDGEGLLHRAFSIFLFDRRGRLLLQQRSPQKRLWPGFWANSCCSHPRRGESDTEAAARRIHEELGVSPPLTFLYRFEYHARYGDLGSEHELCSVYAATDDHPVRVNINEIADIQWIEPDALDAELAEHPERYAPWLKLEWPQVRADHWARITGSTKA